MFANLPEEIERYIWKLYLSDTVMSQIKNKKTIWFQASNEIKKKDYLSIMFPKNL